MAKPKNPKKESQGATLDFEHICEETTDEVVLMKDRSDRVIGIEILHYRPACPEETGFTVETVVKTGTG